jgi:hypothetical protein
MLRRRDYGSKSLTVEGDFRRFSGERRRTRHRRRETDSRRRSVRTSRSNADHPWLSRELHHKTYYGRNLQFL